MVRPVLEKDIVEICDIYNYYVEHTVITFEVDAITAGEMEQRIFGRSGFPWLVYEKNEKISGFAYASCWKSRSAYNNSVESTVYLKKSMTRVGIGQILYRELLFELKKLKYHTVLSGIALPNKASIALHEKHGFKKVAHFKEIGFKHGRWIDVGYWQLIFDQKKIK